MNLLKGTQIQSLLPYSPQALNAIMTLPSQKLSTGGINE